MTSNSQNKNAKPASFWFIGVHVSSSVRKLEAALIGTTSLKPNAPITLQRSVSFDLPSEIIDAFDEIQAEIKRTSLRPSFASEESLPGVSLKSDEAAVSSFRTSSLLRSITFLRAALASIEEEAVIETLADSGVDKKDVAAVVVNDPILLLNDSGDESVPIARLSLGNASELASKTGLNVLDAFLAPPYSSESCLPNSLAFSYWTLLGADERDKLILDLGETARFTYLPSSNEPTSWKKIVSQSIVPCGSLLNALAFQTTKGASFVDVGGKLSVQGRCSNELLNAWNEVASKSGSSAPLDKDAYLSALRSSNLQTSSIDALCTAACFIANQTYETIRSCASKFSDSFDLIIVGGAKLNGLLVSKASALFKSYSRRSLADYGYLEDSFDAAAVATLGALYVADIPIMSSAEGKSLDKSALGRISPGSSDNWKRFCRLCAGSLS